MTRRYPENRNREVRLASRRAYHERNKDRINENLRKKRGKVADWWAGVCARIENIVKENKI